ncbi:hypothetical protein OS493_000907 [Desmophyllum pertusum]|uniref:HIRAN domain-containing protein n=1 Tax=Desmophyllum pertusum TaxID=174260 RepID=A0A9W9ZTC7_9CNID|nr:hypothetical protein OS493_000907 [Desmophyllum pertusum]
MAEEYKVFVESSVRGYHEYFKYATVVVGDVLHCEVEENNQYDKYAVAIKSESNQTVGHVPIELSKLFCEFLADGGSLEAECIGHRFNAGQGKGLEIPVDYRLIGNKRYLKILVRKLSEDLSVSAMRKCTTSQGDL